MHYSSAPVPLPFTYYLNRLSLTLSVFLNRVPFMILFELKYVLWNDVDFDALTFTAVSVFVPVL